MAESRLLTTAIVREVWSQSSTIYTCLTTYTFLTTPVVQKRK